MHQPSYADPETGEITMPWVRLHGSRDYVDMARVMELAPRARATVNWVPGLLDQLKAVGDPRTQASERFWRLSIADPATLSAGDLAMIRKHFFSLPDATMLAPWPRYRELRDIVNGGSELSHADVIDLQVWFNLAWCGVVVRESAPIAALVAKGRDFAPDDRLTVLEAQAASGGGVEARWAALASTGAVELTLSPYYHPIIPLLIDTHAARESIPDTPLPHARFRHPDDADAQITRAFGPNQPHFHHDGAPVPIRGMWPSEGSLSDSALCAFKNAGVEWLISDETLLHKALAVSGKDDGLAHCKPWNCQGVTVFFRDHGLSDRIGFVYANWDRRAAYRDFVAHLQRVRAALARRGEDTAVIVVALDGENCWEHYPGGVTAFLPGLYDAIADADGLQLVTLSEAKTAQAAHTPNLPRIPAGSWIDGTFQTWLGDPVKNRAWDELAAVREAVGRSMPDLLKAESGDPVLADLIMRAEASDWWWWFGQGHSTPFDGHFDALFRAHIRAIWHHLGRPHPDALNRTLYAAPTDDQLVDEPPTGRTDRHHDETPVALGSVETDGRDDWYYKWIGAGRITPRFGAIHRAEPAILGLLYTHDSQTLYLRVEVGPVTSFVRKFGPETRIVLCLRTGTQAPLRVLLATTDAPLKGADICVTARHRDQLEASIPLAKIGARMGGAAITGWVELQQAIDGGDHAMIERFPAEGDMRLTLIGPKDAARLRRI